MKGERYTVRPGRMGAEIVDETRGLPVAWCGDASSVGVSGSFSVRGIVEAERIAFLLNEADKPARGSE